MLQLFPDERPQVIESAVAQLAASGEKERGAVHTLPEVVRFILDLAGYTSEKRLFNFSILEPSFGHGECVIEIVNRLLTAYTRDRAQENIDRDVLARALTAVDLNAASYEQGRERLDIALRDFGFKRSDRDRLIASWLIQDDFLLARLSARYHFVVGNPPYVRQELIPTELIEEYRRRFETIYDRADLYVPFFEKSLSLLRQGGLLGFICSDRWIMNKYGGPLRNYIAANHWRICYVDMGDIDAFEGEVSAGMRLWVH